MAGIKTVFVGGGSFNWGPQLIRDFVVAPELQDSTLVLHDLDPEAARANLKIAKLLREQAGASLALEVEDDRRLALRDADYVLLAISTGGLEAWRLDMEIPEKYGCRQTIADTVGPGGFSRALRNIPVVVGLARDMEELCPQAWLLNVTNPMTILTRAVWKATSITCLGLCHEVYGLLRYLEKALGVDRRDISYNYAGLNHCGWILDLTIKGQDGMAMLPEYWRDESDLQDTVAAKLREVYGCLPVWKGRHLCEFFPHFLTAESGWGERYGFLDQMVTVKDRFEYMAGARARWLRMQDGEDLPSFRLGHEPIVPVIVARETGKRFEFIANWPNQGQIANLPLDAVVETKAVADARGITPFSAGKLPEGVRAVLARHVSNQELIVHAALAGDYQAALQAFANDPLVRSLESAKAMLDELLEAHRQYLPRFAEHC